MSRFPTTSWSMVVAARGHPAVEGRDALTSLCEAYWYPIYQYIRHRGYPAQDAEDLTQQFFARLIEKSFLSQADRARGRFRSFLLGAVKHFLAGQSRHARAQKRGGAIAELPVDTAADNFHLPDRESSRPDKSFERRWALTVLGCALESLRPIKHFDHLKQFLTGEHSDISYVLLSAELGMSEGALKVAIHRLRRRFAQSLREEIARTVVSPAEVDEEIRYLLAVIRG
ncbi:MAG: sigma-70 family RNA polymerase sigma factor [Deltaproteobacteria bacterium]|nr:sigma-70 family RNA polymerase sigma factor [Deltaproteobacteria bacterium]